MKEMSDLMSTIPVSPQSPKFSFSLPELEVLFKALMSYYETLLDLWENGDSLPFPKLAVNTYGWDSEDYSKLSNTAFHTDKDVVVFLINKFSAFNFTVE